MPRRLALPLLLAAAALGAACRSGDDVAAAGWETVTDTIGDTVVVRTVGASDTAAALRLEETVRIGEFEGADEYTFAAVQGIVPAPGGAVWVWDGTVKALRLYDSAGRFVRQLGRRGGGPGEYEESNGMAGLPDGRLAFWDPRNARVALFDTAGPAAGGWRVAAGFFTSRAVVADTAGTVALMQMLDAFDQRTPLARRRTGWVRYRVADGQPLDSLAPPLLPDESLQLTARTPDGGSSSSTNVPFSPPSTCAFGVRGYFVCGNGARYAVTLHRPEGPLRIERDADAPAVQADEKASEEETVTAMMRGTDPSWRWNGPTIPDRKPVFRSLQVAADGRVWVQRSRPGERIPDEELAELEAARRGDGPNRIPPRRWRERLAYDVFEPDGRFVGHLLVPRRTSLMHMRADTVWAVERDSLDVPYVVRFRLLPPGAPAAGNGR